MSSENALLTFSIGPVHAFISQARRVTDVWAGSDLLSHLMGTAIERARSLGARTVFPALEEGEDAPGIPNRVVCRVPEARVEECARAMEQAVEDEWRRLATEAVKVLRTFRIDPAPEIWTPEGEAGPRQTDHVFQAAWSWVPEGEDYAAASLAGARRFAASRLCRPFVQVEQHGEKCALCGERTALPDGVRSRVRAAWEAAEAATPSGAHGGDARFFRFDQGRLCLVCATKRLYTRSSRDKQVYFQAFDRFDREALGEDGADERAPYVALVCVDGDNMSRALSVPADRIAGGRVEEFHRDLSRALNRFASSLRTRASGDSLRRAQINLDTLGIRSSAPRKNRPQLIYAGGDDVLVVCSPADALPVARALEQHYRAMLDPLAERLEDAADRRLTLSGAILYSHGRYPAGAMFRDVQDLLKHKAKDEAGRDALALRLDKRGGVPVEVAFRWREIGAGAEVPWPQALDELVTRLREKSLGSGLTFNLRREEKVLLPVLPADRWVPWLRDRLGRSGVSAEHAPELAARIAPFFQARKTEALRIARFLGREVAAEPEEPAGEEVAS